LGIPVPDSITEEEYQYELDRFYCECWNK